MERTFITPLAKKLAHINQIDPNSLTGSGPRGRIIKSDVENNLIYLRGSIPGSMNSTVLLRESIKNITRKTIKERHEAKIKAAAAKKGKK